MCLFLQVPMPLFSMELSHPAKEVIFNLAIYPVKTSIWQDCFNCPACEQQWKSVFIKRVSTVWTARPGIRGLKSASAPDSVITPVERPRCFKHPLNDFHTHTHTLASLHLRDKGKVRLLSLLGSNVKDESTHRSTTKLTAWVKSGFATCSLFHRDHTNSLSACESKGFSKWREIIFEKCDDKICIW